MRSELAELDLNALRGAVRTCTACPELAATRTQVVVGDTPVGARLLLLGEAPGATEDQTGRPFVGRSGALLDELLTDVGVDRAAVAVLNTVKCRPPGNRTPTRAESATCRPWTDRQLTLAAPAVIVALGLSATRWLLGATSLRDARGRVHDTAYGPLIATYHPSAALRWGPGGEPRRLLREDLAWAAELAAAASA